jgi:putative membrane protein
MEFYLLAKTLHLIAVISWMAGLLYLPRLYVYHSGVAVGSETSEMFKVMERRLLRAIMNPAMIAAWGIGIWLIIITGAGGPGTGGWMHAKLALLLGMSGLHGFFAAEREKFARDQRPRSTLFYRIINEVVTVLMVAIIVLVIFKPF